MLEEAVILAIDPGVHGAFALYSPNDPYTVQVQDVPTLKVKVAKRTRNQPDLHRMHAYFTSVAMLSPTHVICEEPHSMPHDGVVQAFTLGHCCGAIQAFITGLGCPVTYIRPNAWKLAMRLTGDKDLSRKRASQLFPQGAWQWERVRDDGRAEAALLAYYFVHLGGSHAIR